MLGYYSFPSVVYEDQQSSIVNLQGLSSKEAELLKDGTNAEKSCTCSKQIPVTTDPSKSVNISAGETDTPSSSNAPASLELMEMEDTLPSSSGPGAPRNHLFKIGI